MIIHQAIYGSEHGGHALLACSAADTKSFIELAWHTDLPGNAPPGATWEPYLSGFAHGENYVLVRTFPDQTSARGGMVLSHALFIPIGSATESADLRAIAKLLIREPIRPAALVPFDFPTSSGSDALVAQTTSVAGLAEALLVGGKEPVVWVGQVGFDNAIFALWSRLWPAARRAWSFRLSFGPQDCADAPPTLVCTPATLESKWAGYRLVNPSIQDVRSEAAQMLLGLTDGDALRTFIDQLGPFPQRLGDLPLFEACRRYLHKSDPTVDDLLSATRLLGRVSPSPKNGHAIKNQLVEQLASNISRTRAVVICSMRNLDLNAFSKRQQIWKAVSTWVTEFAISNAAYDPDTAKVFVLANSDEGLVAEWKSAVWEGFEKASAASNAKDFASATWVWWIAAPSLVSAFINRIPQTSELEAYIADACPKSLGRSISDIVLNQAQSRSWYRLHAAAAVAAYDLDTALARQLSFDSDVTSVAGLQTLFRSASGEQVVKAALRHPDPRLVVLSAEACTKNLPLMRELEIGNPTWQAIWAATIRQNIEAWRGPAEPLTVARGLADAAVSGGISDVGLWRLLTKTPLNDLSLYPRRPELWRVLPSDVTEALKASTADGWLQHFADDPAFDQSLEIDLRRAIVNQSRVRSFLHQLVPKMIVVGVNLFNRFTELPEPIFETWLADMVSNRVMFESVPVADAVAFGRLIYSRKWGRSASRLASAVLAGHRAFSSPLIECLPLLSILERLRLRLTGAMQIPDPSADELWQVFEQTAVELYSNGPNDNQVWSRAGGSPSKLRNNLTGLAGWHEAILLLRRGGGGKKITSEKLLATMRNDFHGNDRLRWLAEQKELRPTVQDQTDDPEE